MSFSPSLRISGWLWPLGLLAALLLGAALRLPTLGDAPLWLDEGYSVWFSDQGWRFLWADMAHAETFPPLYYSMLKLWREVAGSGEAALRLPSALAGIATIGVMAVAGRRAGGVALGVIAALLCALWQFQIHYSMEARSYAFAGLAAAMILAGAVTVLTRPEALARPWRAFLRHESGTAAAMGALAAGLALAPWTHMMGAIPPLLAGGYLLGWWVIRDRRRAVLAKLLVVAGVAVLLYLPNWRFVAGMADRDIDSFWLQAPPLWKLVQMTVQVFSQPLPGLALKPQAALMAVLCVAGAVGLWRVARGPVFGLVLVLAFGHWLALVGLTYLVQPVVMPRTLIFSEPPLFLLLAALPWCLRGLAPVLAVLLLGQTAAGLAVPPAGLEKPPYDEMAAAIAENPDAGAPLFAVPGHIVQPFNYYAARHDWQPDLRALPFAAPDFARSPPVIGFDDIGAAEVAQMHAQTADHPTLWLLLGNGIADPAAFIAALEAQGYRQTVITGHSGHYPQLSRFDRSATLAESVTTP